MPDSPQSITGREYKVDSTIFKQGRAHNVYAIRLSVLTDKHLINGYEVNVRNCCTGYNYNAIFDEFLVAVCFYSVLEWDRFMCGEICDSFGCEGR